MSEVDFSGNGQGYVVFSYDSVIRVSVELSYLSPSFSDFGEFLIGYYDWDTLLSFHRIING